MPSLQPRPTNPNVLYEEMKDSKYFQQFSRSQGLAICHAVVERVFDPGAILFRVGDVVSNVYIVKVGIVHIFRYDETEFHGFSRLKPKHLVKRLKHPLGQRAVLGKQDVNASCRCKAQAYFRSCPKSEGILLMLKESDLQPELWGETQVSINEEGLVSLKSLDSEANRSPFLLHNIKECTQCEYVETNSNQDNLFPMRLQFLNGSKVVLAASTEEERHTWCDRFTFFSRNRDNSVHLFLKTLCPSQSIAGGECFGHVELDQITANTCLTTSIHQTTAVCADVSVTLLVIPKTLYLQIVKNVEPIAFLQRLKLAQTCELFRGWNRSSLLDIAKAFVLIHASKHDVLVKKGEPIKGVYIVYHGEIMLCNDTTSQANRPCAPESVHPLLCRQMLAYGEFYGLQETLRQVAADAFVVARTDARVFLFPTKDFHRILHFQTKALQAAYSLDPPDPTGPTDDPPDGWRGGGGGLSDRPRTVDEGACARVLNVSTRSLSEGVPGLSALLRRVRTPRSPSPAPPRPPGPAGPPHAVYGRPALSARVGRPSEAEAGAGRVELVRRQLGWSPRGCAPSDEGLLEAARQPARPLPRPPPGPAVRPPRLDLTEVVRTGRGRCVSARLPGGAAPTPLPPREEELVRLLRAVVASRSGEGSSPAQLVKDLIACEKGSTSESASGAPGRPDGGRGNGPRLLRIDGLGAEQRPEDVEAELRFLFRGLAVPRHGIAVLLPPGSGGPDSGASRSVCAFVAVDGAEDALAALNRAALRGLAASESSLDELAAAGLVAAASGATDPRLCRAAADGHGLLSAFREPPSRPPITPRGSGPAVGTPGLRSGRLASADLDPGGGWGRPGRRLPLPLSVAGAGGPRSGLPGPLIGLPTAAGSGLRPSTVPSSAPGGGWLWLPE